MLSRALMAAAGLFMAGVLTGCAGGGDASSDAAASSPVSDAGRPAVVEARALSSELPLEGDRATLLVQGLSCPLCATNIDKMLAREPGVDGVRVDLSTGRVQIGLKGASRPSPSRLGEVVDKAGFTLVGIEQP